MQACHSLILSLQVCLFDTLINILNITTNQPSQKWWMALPELPYRYRAASRGSTSGFPLLLTDLNGQRVLVLKEEHFPISASKVSEAA